MSSTSSKITALMAVFCVFATFANAGVPVFVMLPLDTITLQNTLNDPQQLKANLYTLKQGGVTGVMSDTWWGLTEPSPQQYNFSGYIDLLEMVQEVGLKYQAIMSFHQCGGNVGDACNVPIPEWVRSIASNHDAFYKDAEGNVNQEYISLFADNAQIFQGRTPRQMYQDYMVAFSKAFSRFMGNTIVEIEVGLGPAGEMRYPSYPLSRWSFCGVGEFQCSDSFALANLSSAAAAAGHPEWGHGGPDNAGNYDSHPSNTGFFSNNGGDNFQSDYGRFFLGWYADSLINHGDAILGDAAAIFHPQGVSIAGKVAGIHWWYKDISHAAELTAGYFNTDNHDAYAAIAKMFAKHGASFDFTCLEMRDNEQPSDCDCGPFELVQQTKAAAHAAGIGYSGENALPRYDQTAYNTIEQQSASLGYLIDEFTYLRLNPTLLDGNNFNTFKGFVNAMNNLSPSAHEDEEEEVEKSE